MAKNLTDLNGNAITLDVEQNVKVKGEKAMRKGVVLTADPNDPERVRVKTGKRGRPATLPVDLIQSTRVL